MKKNRAFVQTMIIGSVVGLIILMGMMFMGIQWVLNEQQLQTVQNPSLIPQEEQVQDVVFNSSILGVITELVDREVTLFDINKKQQVVATIEPTTRVTDAYNQIMPMTQLVVGDIVELAYEPQNDELVGISIAEEVWKKSDLRGIQIDRSNRTIKIGNQTYTYVEQTVVLNKQGEPVGIYEIGDYDVLELKGIHNEIYSIQATREQGYLDLGQLPSYEGVIEINTNRHIPLSEGMLPIPLGEGTHKVVLRMEGYETIVQEIQIVAGETLVFSGENAQQRYTTVYLMVLNQGIEYTAKIGNQSYPQGEPMRVLSGTHLVTVSAQGYQTWSAYVNLEEPEVYLQVVLTEETGPEDTEEDTSNDSNDSNNGETPSPEDESEDEGNTEDYTVSIATDPENARVYINNRYRGESPYKVTLQLGEYQVRIEKQGYETYETNILIDSEDQTNNYKYILVPEQDEGNTEDKEDTSDTEDNTEDKEDTSDTEDNTEDEPQDEDETSNDEEASEN